MTTIFKRARLTNDPSQTLYDVRIDSGIVADITEHQPAASAHDANVIFYDLNGAFCAPSMVDNHVHFSVWAKARKDVQLGGAKSLDAVIQRMNAALLDFDSSKKPAIVGGGLFVGEWADADIQRMTKRTLDTLIERNDVPMVIRTNDLHSSFVNSAFIELLHLDPASSGLLLEQESFDAMTMLDRLLESSIFDDLRDACDDAARRGVTKIVDLDMQHNISNWTRRVQQGLNKLRVECGMYAEHVHDAIEAGLKTDDIIADTHGLATVGPFKIITDGSLGTRTACCHTAYPSPPALPNDHGVFAYGDRQLSRMLAKANDNGLRLAVHAIGDRAHSLTFDAFESLTSSIHPRSTIEHAQLLLTEDLPRFKKLGLLASIQPQHLNDDRELAERFWPSCTARAFPYGDLQRAGIDLLLGSDAPVSPLDPWLAISAGISRRRPGETHEGWHPEQKIDLVTAYRGTTSGQRLQVSKDDVADLCILPLDPLACDVDQIRTMEVMATMLGGRFTYNTLKAE